MTDPGLLRASLLSLALLVPALAAAAPPAAPPAAASPTTAPAAAPASEEPTPADAEKQAQAEAEKKKAEAEKQKKVNLENQKQTVADIRNLGTALYSWLSDQTEATVADQEAEAAAAGAQPPPKAAPEDPEDKTFDIQDNPLISRDDLEEILVPKYLAALPETDAWGNPYEVRINTDNLMAKTVISIRSPGRKGYYAGDVYKLGGFEPTDFDQDIVWADGFFIRWPQSPGEAGKPLPVPPPGRK